MDRDLKSVDIMEGFVPFDGEEHYELHNYHWYIPRNDKDLGVLNARYDLCFTKHYIGKLVCVEEDNGGMVWCVSTFDGCMEYVRNFLQVCGYDLHIKKADYDHIYNKDLTEVIAKTCKFVYKEEAEHCDQAKE